MSEPQDCIFCKSVFNHFMTYSRLIFLQSLKQIIICEKLSLQVDAYPFCLAGCWKHFEDLKFSFWAILLSTRQKVNGWLLHSTVQELFSIFDTAQ